MEKVYHYLRMTKQRIEKKIDPDYQRGFPDISSQANIWNISDDKSDEEESISNDCTLYSENICFFISSLCNEMEKRINTDYAVTGGMLCVIPQIIEYVFKDTQNKHHIQVNNDIKTLFAGSTENSYIELSIRSGANIKISIIRMILLTAMNLSGIVKILVMIKFIYGIKILFTIHRSSWFCRLKGT